MNKQNLVGESWDDIRVAYHVARLGTLSAAADHLGIHHATVIRKIDALENLLGSKLFHRHPRGYTPTDAGLDLLRVGAETQDQLTRLMGQLRGHESTLGGELIVTTVSGLSHWLTPLLAEFQRQNDDVTISLMLEDRPLQMEYGEAHIALRAGARPQEPDNIVQRLCRFPGSLFATKSYLEKFGPLENDAAIANHRFVVASSPTSTAPCHIWERQHIPKSSIVYRASEVRSAADAIVAGIGIGFLDCWSASNYPGLIQMVPSRAMWDTHVWMVTHSALHRTVKIQMLLSSLKQQVKSAVRENPALIS